MQKVTMYKSKSGKIFENVDDCAKEDGYVLCFSCKGKGIETFKHRIPYPSGLPDSGWVDDTIEIRERPCSRCGGLKYVAYNKEEDPEYILYKKLQDKYGGL